MLKNVPLMIGLRYIRAKRRNQFISFVSGFSLLGMALGVMSLIIVMSVMNGFDREMKSRILQVIPHGYVDFPAASGDWQTLRARLLQYPDVEAAAPYVGGFALAGYSRGVEGVSFSGIDPALQAGVSEVARSMMMGELDQLQPGQFNIVLGALLARQLGVIPGDKITLTLPRVRITPAGAYPLVKRFTVVGVFEVGAPVDQTLALMHMDDAARLLRQSGPSGLQVQVSDIYRAGEVLSGVRAELGETFKVRDWSQTQGSLFQAVKMEKLLIGVLLSIIVVVAAFNIVSSLVLMVADKRSDIAVLRTLGLNSRQVMGIFMVQGSGVGVIGIVSGAIVGVLVALNISALVAAIERFTGLRVFDPNVYFISHLPSELYWSDVWTICSLALALSLLASLYPAWRAGRVQPAEALRYE
ncbi:lipoprotein-releasing ABC transporter permease subunit [Gilvimarinus algae]|uniref:Lipoprotein-releasing ABC transporter permease subunit n=1 Tax=Gilvimarinus algae TaxID=3058037 RepID=A0ABT8TFL5_9GAMM|nr:lipoprotein-releasing ABC transporter permease subunit [Gilvimarinus sp. SDUM040014]MDO3382716.1 lipoprotein-releasing ABC transporter permease subunit [Gilvimarinus sp. SDUM040014]